VLKTIPKKMTSSGVNLFLRALLSRTVFALVATVFPLDPSAEEMITLLRLSPSRVLPSRNLSTVSGNYLHGAHESVKTHDWNLGIRIKAKEDETGTIKGVTYSDITLSSISE
jgi:hypothetical protein